jgi:poly-beta-hydroxyalkanoate depolymerase
MNAIPHREAFSSLSPYDPMGFGQVTADLMMAFTSMGLQTSQMSVQAFQQAAKLITSPPLPSNVTHALDEAQRRNDEGLAIPALDFDIHTTSIGGKTIPVEVSSEKISDTCRLWHFTCQQVVGRRHHLLYPSPISGSTATIAKPLLSLLLPAMDVSVTEWTVPQNLPLFHKDPPKSLIKFALDENVDDLVASARSIMAFDPNGFSAYGLSQGGSALTMAAPSMVGLENVILAAAPINTRINPSLINWMARINEIDDRIIKVVGEKYEGAGRPYIPAGVMQALYTCIPDKLDETFDRQDLIADHTIQTHREIFQKNSLATGQLRIHGELLNFKNSDIRLMVAEGEKDLLVPRGQTQAARELFSASRDYYPLRIDTDHYGFARPGVALQKLARAIIDYTGYKV